MTKTLTSWIWLALVSGLITGMGPNLAHAGLGDYDSKITSGNSSGSSSESSTLKAIKVVRKATALYTVHELDTGGNLIREYSNSNGVIFAVTWKGIGTPDLATLFGSYYAEYSAAQAQTVKTPATRRNISVTTSNIVVRRSGHMRAWQGRAAVASLVPAGVDTETLP